MNEAQRRVLVRGLLVAGFVFGVIALEWLTDYDTDNDARGLLLFVLSVGAIIGGLFVRAGTPTSSPGLAVSPQPDERLPPSPVVERGIKRAIADWKKKRKKAAERP